MIFTNDILFENNNEFCIEDKTTTETENKDKSKEQITTKQIKHIHVLLNSFNIDDDDYRQMLDNEFDVRTCKHLTYKQAEELIHKLHYDNDIAYRYGYNTAIERHLDCIDLVDLFINKFKPTDLELKMFKMFSKEQQQAIVLS